MKKTLFNTICFCFLLLPLTSTFALIPMSDDSYSSGPYIGIEGGYAYTIDSIKCSGATCTPAIDRKVHRGAYTGGVYIGYGHLFHHGNLPYLGIEAGFNIRSNYNRGSTSGEGVMYGTRINATKALSLDLVPGVFFDDNTGLIYGHFGVEGDRFTLRGTNVKETKDGFLARIGVGLEHELVNNFYMRADYVLAIAPSKIAFKPYSANPNDQYSARPWFNTVTLGISYRFET